MMIYEIQAASDTRVFNYTFDSIRIIFKRYHSTTDENTKLFPSYEFIRVRISDQNEDFIQDDWVMLHGTPREIVDLTLGEMRIAQYEYNKNISPIIRKRIDQNDYSPLTIAYRLSMPDQETELMFEEYGILDKLRKQIVMDMYDIKDPETCFTFDPSITANWEPIE